MEQINRTVEQFLVVSSDRGAKAASDWQPFEDGDTIGQILANHNHWCQKSVTDITAGMLSECQQRKVPWLELAAVDLDQPELAGGDLFDRTTIVLLDLDAIDGNGGGLAFIRDQLRRQQRPFHLVQISRSMDTPSRAGFFHDGARPVITGPEVILWQWELEETLDAYCRFHGYAWLGVVRNPIDAPCTDVTYNEPYIHPRHGHFIQPQSEEGRSISRIYHDYHEDLPRVVATVRDAAMARRLSQAETINLGRAAALQAFMLAFVKEQVRPQANFPVSVEPIRRSLLTAPVEQPLELAALRPVELVCLRQVPSGGKPPPAAQATLEQLGFLKGALMVLQFNCPDVWGLVETAQDLLTVNTVQAELPAWQEEEAPCPFRLNERAFGVAIEESFYRRADNQTALNPGT